MIKIATIYISVVFAVYLLSGLGLVWFQAQLMEWGFATIVGTVVGVVVILGGLVEIKDFFWYGRGFSLSIPAKQAAKLKERIEQVSVGSAIFLGAFAAVVELPCTGGPYLAITALLAESFNWQAFFYLIIYNLIFVLPLIVITALAYWGVEMAHIQEWKQDKRKWMRLATGIIMVLLGVFLILYYHTTWFF